MRSLLGEKRRVAAVCVSSSFCVTCSCFLSHFVSRDHFKSEVSCGSPMVSASWALLPGGELCSILIHDICLRCDGPVSREAAMINLCTRFFVLVPALFLFSHTNFDNFCGPLHQLFFWISLSLCFSPFWWFRQKSATCPS